MSQPKRFRTILTHNRPHVDEILGIVLLRKYGERHFPGVSTASIKYVDPNQNLNCGKLEETGVLCVGVGGGRFDEHPSTRTGKERDKEECAATLVAKYLDIHEKPELSVALRFVVNNDTKGNGHPFDIASLSKIMYDMRPHDEVVQFLVAGIEAKLQEQYELHWVAARDYKRAGTRDVLIAGGSPISICYGETSTTQFSKYARIQGATVVIQKDTGTGHVQIFTDNKVSIDMRDMVRTMRIMENECARKGTPADWKDLEKEGMLYGWYFQKGGNMLMNGSKTATGVHPTSIPLSEIANAVTICLCPAPFHPEHAHSCANGHCKGRDCSIFKYGLVACRRVRYEETQRKEAPVVA
ncbi:MAG: hypothetical protein HGA67_02920 [Candidatus Yonathbacteria bacterium]|nr:hypothetical protein [Candidatus Yonathbacteria bacterium]